ncbi:hypothetical protein EHQ12_02515 [Leptospira gomenensis]|nr:hypothetical protein EHQ12_02515 [Leptospira gomenensis]
MYIKAFKLSFLKHWKNEVEYYKTNNVNKARWLTFVTYLPVPIFHTFFLLEFLNNFFNNIYKQFIAPIIKIPNLNIYSIIAYFIFVSLFFTEKKAQSWIDEYNIQKKDESSFYLIFILLPIVAFLIYIIFFAKRAIFM